MGKIDFTAMKTAVRLLKIRLRIVSRPNWRKAILMYGAAKRKSRSLNFLA